MLTHIPIIIYTCTSWYIYIYVTLFAIVWEHKKDDQIRLFILLYTSRYYSVSLWNPSRKFAFFLVFIRSTSHNEDHFSLSLVKWHATEQALQFERVKNQIKASECDPLVPYVCHLCLIYEFCFLCMFVAFSPWKNFYCANYIFNLSTNYWHHLNCKLLVQLRICITITFPSVHVLFSLSLSLPHSATLQGELKSKTFSKIAYHFL